MDREHDRDRERRDLRPKDPAAGPEKDERHEEQFVQILQELRVVQTGVQILSAFLLTLPFTPVFGRLSGAEKAVYVVAVTSATICVALVVAPVSYRNTMSNATGPLLRISSVMARLGVLALLLAVISSVLLAVEVALGWGWAAGVSGGLAAIYVLLWLVLPAWWRRGANPGEASLHDVLNHERDDRGPAS